MRIFVIIVALLTLTAGSARADWTVGGKADGLTYYVDKSSIVRDGDHALMWNLTDYETPQIWQGQTFISSKAQFEYDCVNRRTRVMEEAGFSQHMGRGQQTYTVHGPRAWATANPGTVAETRLGIACAGIRRESKGTKD